MDTRMEWEEPPLNTPYDWPAVARQLREHPDQWLLVFTNGPISTVNAIRQGSIVVLTPIRRRSDHWPGFEVMTRNNKTGPPRTGDLYLRWATGRED